MDMGGPSWNWGSQLELGIPNGSSGHSSHLWCGAGTGGLQEGPDPEPGDGRGTGEDPPGGTHSVCPCPRSGSAAGGIPGTPGNVTGAAAARDGDRHHPKITPTPLPARQGQRGQSQDCRAPARPERPSPPEGLSWAFPDPQTLLGEQHPAPAVRPRWPRVNPNTGWGSRGGPGPCGRGLSAPGWRIPRTSPFHSGSSEGHARSFTHTWNRFQPLRLPCSALTQPNQSLQFPVPGLGRSCLPVPSPGLGKRLFHPSPGLWSGRSRGGRAGDTAVALGTCFGPTLPSNEPRRGQQGPLPGWSPCWPL